MKSKWNSANEKFVAYETMFKIVATLNSPCMKGFHLMQKIEPWKGVFALTFSGLILENKDM